MTYLPPHFEETAPATLQVPVRAYPLVALVQQRITP